jgi:putative transposase
MKATHIEAYSYAAGHPRLRHITESTARKRLKRTIHAKLVLDREGKREAIEREYHALQRQLRGSNGQLYSATKQQAERLKQPVKKQNRHGLKMQEYLMILRHDCVKVQQQKNAIFRWWIRIPVNPRSIWVPMQLPYEQEPLLKHDLRECKLVASCILRFMQLSAEFG